MAKSVLEYNIATRNEHLARNKGKYLQYKSLLSPAIGEYYEIKDRDYKSLFTTKDLYDYTHDGLSDSRLLYNFKPELKKYLSETEDYRDYISETYSQEIVSLTYLKGLLSKDNLTYLLKAEEPAIIRNYDLTSALGGMIITNQNNYGEHDTPLGENTSLLVSNMMYNGATFNTARKRGTYNNVGEDVHRGYITPSLAGYYGNTIENFPMLTELFMRNSNLARYPEATNDDAVGIIDLDKNPSNIQDNNGYVILQELLSKNSVSGNRTVYSPLANGEKYVKYTNKEESSNFSIKSTLDGVDKKTTVWVEGDINNSPPKEYRMYNEGDDDSTDSPKFNADNEWEIYTDDFSPNKGLLKKTHELFKNHTIQTMVGRFKTKVDSENKVTDTAIRDGMRSKGRALFSKTKTNYTNGYQNPFCRTWTYHTQYNTVKNLIRPFNGDGDVPYEIEELQTALNLSYRSIRKNSDNKPVLDGVKLLAGNTVLENNGHVRIAPKEFDAVKKCMFSIENLAWKDVDLNTYLHADQVGPNGGRIMWFPPYDIDFSENVSVSWERNDFIGRGEKVYTYTNTERTGQLSFTILIDHPAVVNSFKSSPVNEEDILRFFAGCSVPEIKDSQDITEKKPDPEYYILDGDDKEKTLYIMVFFPNDYSGHAIAGNWPNGESDLIYDKRKTYATLTSDGRQGNRISGFTNGLTNDKIDTDWDKYLLNGADYNFTANTYTEGYEMLNQCLNSTIKGQSGISNNTYVLYDSKKGNYYKPTDKNIKKFFYRVDADLNQLLTRDEDYKDSNCQNLNSSSESVNKYWMFPIRYSFTDLLYMLYNDKTDGENRDISNFIKKLGLSKSVSTNYSGKAITGQCAGDNLIEELNARKIKSITVQGCATLQDDKNTSTLAKRRAESTAWLIRKLLTNNDTIKVENGENFTVSEEMLTTIAKLTNANRINEALAKAQRCALVKIVVENKNESEKFEDSDNETAKAKNKFNKDYEWPKNLNKYIKLYLDYGYYIATDNNTEASKIKSTIDAIYANNSGKTVSENGKTYTGTEFDTKLSELVYEYYNSLKSPVNEYDAFIAYAKGKQIDVFDAWYQAYQDANATEKESLTEEVYYQPQYYLDDDGKVHEIGGEDIKIDIKGYATIDNVYRKILFISGTTETKYSKTDYNGTLDGYYYEKNYYKKNVASDEAKKSGTTMFTIEAIDNSNEGRQNGISVAEKENLEKNGYDSNGNATIEGGYTERLQNYEASIKASRGVGYGNEYRYFNEIQYTDPVIYKKLTEKFKHFDPAFHSITPEGFNSRLTFLQQCTRQGHTIGLSEGNFAQTAGNLAFGRMPVCVLRIGDFINTRIIIESLSISYSTDGMQWDLNPEGAGVQPMFAKVQMGIVLLGGQSLKGPISRLQNAVSFNYYANTGVYDYRSDTINGDNDTYDIWSPTSSNAQLPNNGKGNG